MDIKDHIRTIADFPKPGILFYDISTLLAAAAARPVALRRPPPAAASGGRGGSAGAALSRWSI